MLKPNGGNLAPGKGIGGIGIGGNVGSPGSDGDGKAIASPNGGSLAPGNGGIGSGMGGSVGSPGMDGEGTAMASDGCGNLHFDMSDPGRVSRRPGDHPGVDDGSQSRSGRRVGRRMREGELSGETYRSRRRNRVRHRSGYSGPKSRKGDLHTRSSQRRRECRGKGPRQGSGGGRDACRGRNHF
jgi:hypothetical protein